MVAAELLHRGSRRRRWCTPPRAAIWPIRGGAIPHCPRVCCGEWGDLALSSRMSCCLSWHGHSRVTKNSRRPPHPCFCENSVLSGPGEAMACHWLQPQQKEKGGRVRGDRRLKLLTRELSLFPIGLGCKIAYPLQKIVYVPSDMGFHWKRLCHMCACVSVCVK